MFLSPAEHEYIPRTIVDRASTLHSYNIEAQGRQYHRTREHFRPIYLSIFNPLFPNLKPKPQTLKPSHIPKPPPPNTALPHTTPSIHSFPKAPPCFPCRHIPGHSSLLFPSLYPLPPSSPHWLIDSYTIYLH